MTGIQDEQQASDFPRAIGKPAQRALTAAGYRHLADLTTISEKALGRLHGVGPKAIGVLRSALAAQDLSFADD
jgi:hypothetical protein